MHVKLRGMKKGLSKNCFVRGEEGEGGESGGCAAGRVAVSWSYNPYFLAETVYLHELPGLNPTAHLSYRHQIWGGIPGLN